MRNRVVVTGLGAITPIGIGTEQFSKSLQEGKSGITEITQFETSDLLVKYAGEVKGFDPNQFISPKQIRRLDRFSQLGLSAAKMAVVDSRLELNKENKDRIGVSIGTSIGALGYAEKQLLKFIDGGQKAIHPFFGSHVISSSCTTEITIEFKLSGATYTNGNACTASTCAIGMAFHMIREGQADVMISGGAEAPISPVIIGSLGAAKILSLDPQCSPFSKDRNGMILGEGSAMLILESLDHALERGASIFAEVVGYGISCDGFHHLLQPPRGEKAALALQKALNDAKLNPEDIDYINAHGSGTIMNDKTETFVIKRVFGKGAFGIPISATKSLIGHTMGACGALELAACVLMIRGQFLHPTINYHAADPECDLDYTPNKSRPYKVDKIMKISFGFGGYNAACVLSRYQG